MYKRKCETVERETLFKIYETLEVLYSVVAVIQKRRHMASFEVSVISEGPRLCDGKFTVQTNGSSQYIC
jgi:hypothetical protein